MKPRSSTAAGPNWKPERCHDCGKKHPAFNKDGGRAGTPWRCGPCDKLAKPIPRDQLVFAPPVKVLADQGQLL